MLNLLGLIAPALLFSSAVFANPVQLDGSAGEAPVINSDFPDPAIIRGPDGTYFAYATGNSGVHVQIASAPSPAGPWTVHAAKDALPRPGSWSTGQAVWAPFVMQVTDGSYVLYYSAQDASHTNLHCVGAATAAGPQGPFMALPTPLACPISQGGAIDASGFKDIDGSYYVTYKVDGNAIGHGGLCNNAVAPIVPTPIMIQPVASNGVTPVGQPFKALDRSDADGPLIEAPSLIRSIQGVYILFFSSNCYSSTNYDVSYATALNVHGPYTKSSAPLLVTGDYGLSAPGGATALQDGSAMVFHANCPAGRCMYERTLTIKGDIVST